MELTLDLGDDLPPVTIAPKDRAPKPQTRYSAPQITIASIPEALAVSVCEVHCRGCGGTFRDHRGIFLESRLSNGVRSWHRISMNELVSYRALPRRIDFAPPEDIPACEDCFLLDALFEKLIANSTPPAPAPEPIKETDNESV